MSSDNFPLIPYPWQQPDWQKLQHLHQQGSLPHALMLAGQKGIGKKHLAGVIAQYLLCSSPVNGLPCNQCRSCELQRASTHPDLFCVSPEEAGKAIKVDQVRELTEFVTKTSQQGGRKVILLEPAEAMNVNAANALLKCLEEPAGDTLLILVTHSVSAVMATIRSRCQLRQLVIPTSEVALPWLQPLVNKQADAAQLLSYACGAPLAALALLEEDRLEQRQAILNDLSAIALGRDSSLAVAARWQKGYQPLVAIDWLLKWLHELACLLVGREQAFTAVPAEFQVLAKWLSPALLYRYQDKVLQAKKQLLSGANPNKQLLLEELLMDWNALSRSAAKRQATG